MNISKVKTAFKIGQFKYNKDSNRNLSVVYDSSLSKDILTSPDPRVYIFTLNGVIKKIGGSIDKGGIKSTLSLYENALSGSPGPSRFVLNQIIEQSLKEGDVEIFMINSPRVIAKVTGLFTINETPIAAFKEMEDYCKSDYFKEEKKYPDWNFQENKQDYPSIYYQRYLDYHQKRINKKSI